MEVESSEATAVEDTVSLVQEIRGNMQTSRGISVSGSYFAAFGWFEQESGAQVLNGNPVRHTSGRAYAAKLLWIFLY
jgi:hypothetical protein